MSVVVEDKTGKTQLVTKGAVKEMIKYCTYAELNGKVVPHDDEVMNIILKKTEEYNEKGMRVLAIAHKTDPAPVG